ncbi:MAG TPA: peptidoglycan DD-metalloendopeptidase family protein [Stellaceae bacterium]|nr:peptidoglycan DD-metalloendopeptidase family protein [Stellaceae bacterium]
MAKVSQILGEQLFPERQLLLQSRTGVRHVTLPGWLQAMLLAASLATVGAVAYLCVGFVHLRDRMDSRVAETTPSVTPTVTQEQVPHLAAMPTATTPSDTPPASSTASADIAQMRNELAALHQQVATLSQNYAQASANAQQASDKVTALTQQNSQLEAQLNGATARTKTMQEARDEAERHAKTSEQALSSKSGNSEQLAKNLDAARTELQQSEVQRTTLQNRVQQLQMDLQSAQARADQIDAQHNPQVASDPIRAPAAPAPALVQPVAPEVAPPERKPLPAGVPHAENTVAPNASSGQSSELERLLASTGLDIDRLLHGLGNSSTGGEGGPYIALNDPRATAMNQQRLDDLKKLAKNLPLGTPLSGPYQLGSDYGPRIDPINHKQSFHPGLDLDAPYRTTVYSTGAGTVIFTGNMDSYGKVVEIDHGHGIVTRYAHLHRILVAKGQKVGLHSPIAELGSTGRSTGPHLHYEVRVDGQTVDPAKFMQAGKNVVQVSGQQ